MISIVESFPQYTPHTRVYSTYKTSQGCHISRLSGPLSELLSNQKRLHLRRLQVTLSAAKLCPRIEAIHERGAFRWNLHLHSSTRRSKNLATGAGRCSRK